MKVTRFKNCYCHRCKTDYHYLGIAAHIAAHRRREEDCRVTFTYGDTYDYDHSRKPPSPGKP